MRPTNGMLEQQIVESGRRAFEAGLDLSENPFVAKSRARTLWSEGYRDARRRAKQERADA